MPHVFKKLFGCVPGKIGTSCLILPSNDRGLFNELKSDEINRGLFFNVRPGRPLSLISLKDRSLAGDCVMHLEKTDCKRVFLFGSCGGITIECGEKALVSEALNLESFSSFLSASDLKNARVIRPPGGLSEKILNFAAGKVNPLRCATLSSLYLEEKKRNLLKKEGFDCVDMEASMVFSAASSCSMEAAALLYCADVPGKINYYDEFPPRLREKIKGARRSLAGLLVKFLRSE